MKKLFLFGITSFLVSGSWACDICGCGVGGSYIGILPEFHRHIAGIRYRSNSLQTHLGAGGNITYLTSTEKYSTLELWGGFTAGKKFRIMATVPYAFNERINQGISKNKNGLGDISLTGYYQLLNNAKTVMNEKLLVQSFWIGGGLKLPTGKYTAADKENTSQNTNLFQLGTGSIDFNLNAMYDIRFQDAGLNLSAGYKINTNNKDQYSYGNKITASAQAYYKMRVKKKFTVAPNAGIIYESSKKDIDNKLVVDISGGRLLQGSAGLEITFSKLSTGANWQIPISQKLANDVIRSNNRLMIHLSFPL